MKSTYNLHPPTNYEINLQFNKVAYQMWKKKEHFFARNW